MAGWALGRCVCASLALACCIPFAPRALAQSAAEYPIPSIASEAYSPIGEGFESPIRPREDLKGPKAYVDEREARLEARRKRRLPDMPAFFRDTAIWANSRTYWFDEDAFGFNEPQALTTGGYIAYESGFIADFFQLRSVLYTSQPLYAGEDAGDTQNLSPDGDEITTFGQLNGRFKFAGQQLTAGRQLLRTPYVNPFDVRMIPLTYEGIVLLPERVHQQPLDYTASYVWRYKPLNYDNFIPMSEGLGVEGADEGMLITGIRRRTNAWNYGIVNYWVKDTLNTAYAEIDYLFSPFGSANGAPSFRVSANTLDQRSVGDDLLTGSSFETYQASARLIASYRNFVLTGAVSKVGSEADINEPFGFNPSFTSMFIRSFNNAGERALLVSLSYDFARVGLEGVTFRVAWGKGIDSIDPGTGAPEADEDELDLMLVYEPHQGRLQGLRVEVEYLDWRLFDNQLPSEDLTQLRASVNYSVPLY